MVYTVTYDKCIEYGCSFNFATCGFCSRYICNICQDHSTKNYEKHFVPICRLCYAFYVIKDRLELQNKFPANIF